MKRRRLGMVLILLIVGAVAVPSLASASAFDNLKKGASGLMNSSNSTQSQSSLGATSLLQQLGSGSFNLGSMQNVAGVLGYCQQHGYTKSATEQVKNTLLSKIGGQSQAQQSPAYQQGLSGMLQGGQGKQFSLTSLKDQIGTRVCGAIAHQAMSSFLGS